MDRVLGRLAPYAYVLLRVAAGLLFACHGAQKLFGMFGGHRVPVASTLGLAGGIELIGGVMIALGFLAATAAFVASAEMAYAYVTSHAPRGAWPIRNGGELALLYCALFLYIACRGAGIWAIDKGGSRR